MNTRDMNAIFDGATQTMLRYIALQGLAYVVDNCGANTDLAFDMLKPILDVVYTAGRDALGHGSLSGSKQCIEKIKSLGHEGRLFYKQDESDNPSAMQATLISSSIGTMEMAGASEIDIELANRVLKLWLDEFEIVKDDDCDHQSPVIPPEVQALLDANLGKKLDDPEAFVQKITEMMRAANPHKNIVGVTHDMENETMDQSVLRGMEEYMASKTKH